MSGSFLSDILLIIIAAFLGGFSARTFRLPPVLGYIISGVVFGIIGKNIFQNYDSLVALSQVGISLLLFTLGFEISIDTLIKTNKKVFLVGIAQVVLTALVFFPILRIFGFSDAGSFLFASLFSFSSTAVVVKILEERGLISDFPGNNVFIILLIQDLFIVPVIFLLPILFRGSITTESMGAFLIASIKPLAIFIALIIIGKLFLSKFLDLVFRYPSHELTILATIFTASFAILALTAVGLPPSISAFLAGVLISEQGRNLAPLAEIRPFRDLFLVLFFVLTGMLLNFNFFVSNIVYILLLTAIIIGLKFIVSYIILRLFSYSASSGIFISSYISNIGEFAIVIGQIALFAHFLSFESYNLLLSLFIVSLCFAPLVIGIVKLSAEGALRLRLMKKISHDEIKEFAGEKTQTDLTNHVVICGHGRVGREVRAMLDLSNIPYLVVDINKKIIHELTKISKHAIYGDPSDPDILKAADVKEAKAIVIAVPDLFSQKRIISESLKLNPKIVILCRSHVEEDRIELINLGVNTIIMPELEAGLKIGAETLGLFKLSDTNIEQIVKRVRREHLL
ncbi:MAG TPA: cation:proton antiporter [Patescibacteria group bacterium]|nr:cation:proton antiporter [Patescibacteria group bacterium]